MSSEKSVIYMQLINFVEYVAMYITSIIVNYNSCSNTVAKVWTTNYKI